MSGLYYDRESRIDNSPTLYNVGDVVRLSNGAPDKIVAIHRAKGHSGFGIQYRTKYCSWVWQRKRNATTQYNHNYFPERSYKHPLCESHEIFIIKKIS
jgi:hypothetical protein